MAKPEKNDGNESRSDLAEIFDLDRKQLTARLVDQMQQCMHEIDSARDDLNEIVASAREAQFRPRDVKAMKRIARLRLRDQVGAAREELEALERVGQAVGFNLFDWAETRSE